MQPRTTNSDARSKGARSARKAHVGEFNLRVSEDYDQSVCCSLWTRARKYSLSCERCRCSTVWKLIGSAGRELHANLASMRSVNGPAPKIPGLYVKEMRRNDRLSDVFLFSIDSPVATELSQRYFDFPQGRLEQFPPRDSRSWLYAIPKCHVSRVSNCLSALRNLQSDVVVDFRGRAPDHYRIANDTVVPWLAGTLISRGISQFLRSRWRVIDNSESRARNREGSRYLSVTDRDRTRRLFLSRSMTNGVVNLGWSRGGTLRVARVCSHCGMARNRGSCGSKTEGVATPGTKWHWTSPPPRDRIRRVRPHAFPIFFPFLALSATDSLSFRSRNPCERTPPRGGRDHYSDGRTERVLDDAPSIRVARVSIARIYSKVMLKKTILPKLILHSFLTSKYIKLLKCQISICSISINIT